MMNEMYGIGIAVMILGSTAALAVLALAVLAALWVARSLRAGEGDRLRGDEGRAGL
jgi:hypothetical protein